MTLIRLLEPDDAEEYCAVRRRGLEEEPLSFTASLEDDRSADVSTIVEALDAGPESTVHGAFDDGLVGIIGLVRDRHLKGRHRAFIWGMYVVPEHRRRGLAAALLTRAIEHARSLGVDIVRLSVSDAAHGARCLYERFGFEVWGTEPDTLRHDGQRVDEVHLTLRLDAAK